MLFQKNWVILIESFLSIMETNWINLLKILFEDFNYSMAMREGGLLKDMLCLPLKNAYGQDIIINREPDITYVENCLEKLQNDRENIRDALDLKKLELQQFLQLKICEQNIEQVKQNEIQRFIY